MTGIPFHKYTNITPNPFLSETKDMIWDESLIIFNEYNILEIIPYWENIVIINITTTICGIITGKFNSDSFILDNFSCDKKYANITPIKTATVDDINDVFKLNIRDSKNTESLITSL